MVSKVQAGVKGPMHPQVAHRHGHMLVHQGGRAMSTVPRAVQAAPGRLELARALLNTHDMEEGTDLLAALPAAHRWAQDLGLLDDAGMLTERERRQLVQFRDTLRDALDSNADQTAALDRFNALLTS